MPHILLVEDDADTALALQGILEALGHQVTRAENGKAAVRSVQNGLQPDLVLTDIIMPDMDGIETVQTFQTLLKATPIIAMSALTDTPYLRAAAAFGARETLAKPFTVEQLRNAIARALSNA